MTQKIMQFDEKMMSLSGAVNGKLVESSSDGSTRVIGSLSSPIPVELGSKRSRRIAA